MRFFLESTRYQFYWTISLCYRMLWVLKLYKKEAHLFYRRRSWSKFALFIGCIVSWIIWYPIVVILTLLFRLILAFLNHVCRCSVVPLTMNLFRLATDCPAFGNLDAHLSRRDLTPRNTVPLDLFRFKGRLLFMCDRLLVFEPVVDESYYEALRLLRILTSIDQSDYILGVDSIVPIYNTSPYATSDKNSNSIHLQIPYRGDIRLRSWLKYYITICNENNVHNGLVNIASFSQIALAIRDCCNAWENRRYV